VLLLLLSRWPELSIKCNSDQREESQAITVGRDVLIPLRSMTPSEQLTQPPGLSDSQKTCLQFGDNQQVVIWISLSFLAVAAPTT
jgi:hypothetical protein